ncbi:MAG TPA: peptidylprolyl isomerase [Burkholderiales bacterium]|nr:peptidylprolyl isomerase [Burkholderiales bacterium]
MRIAKNTVVTISYEMSDAEGKLLEKSEQPYSYLHGGYHGVFPAVEQALEGMGAGETCDVTLEPEDAFGEYDEELLRVEPRSLFPESVAVGMQFEGVAKESGEQRLYTVTDVAGDKVVVDGNHPLAGKVVNLACTVSEVRAASAEEIAHGHAHGAHGHHH